MRTSVTVVALVGAACCASNSPGQVLSFTNVTDAAGATFTNTRSPRYGFMAAGGVAADFNNDGYTDLFVLGGPQRRDAMFINNGVDADGNFSFTDEVDQWDLPPAHHSFGASAADFDNDGYLDLFVTSYGPGTQQAAAGYHKLYHNNGPDNDGNWSFTDIAAASGCNVLVPGLADGTSSTWGDFDLDGDLDLMVGCYHRAAYGNRLYRNDGPDGFGGLLLTDVTDEVGLRALMSGLAPAFVDMTGDHYPEMLMAADSGSSQYFVNDGDSTFTNRTSTAEDLGTANGMGVAVGDLNSDGRLDWYVSSSYFQNTGGPGNVLMIQNPDGSFTNIAPGTPVHDGGWGWGVLMVDLNHDRLLDLVETNGFSGEWTVEQSYLYINQGELNFVEQALALGFVHTGQGRGLINADFDNDGDQDMVLFASGEPLSIFRNNLLTPGDPVPAGANWLRMEFDTRARPGLAPHGMHARAWLHTGDRAELLTVDGGTSYASQGEIGCHAGLGDVDVVDYIRIEWNDGTVTTLGDVAANQILRVAAPFNPADYDGSGSLDFADVQMFLNGYAARSMTSDHNADWNLDVYDLLMFLRDFSR